MWIREPHGDSPIEIYGLDGRPAQPIHVRGLDGLDIVGMDWTADGDGLYVGARLVNSIVLERVDLRGNVHVLINDKALDAPIWGIESPDRRHLAIQEQISGGNIWIIDNF